MTNAQMIKPEDIKRLREQTGAGIMDCKRALEESGGDYDKAVLWLREKGLITDAVTDEDARRFEHGGVTVRSIPGAAHTVWYSHFEVFTAALPELFAPSLVRPG